MTDQPTDLPSPQASDQPLRVEMRRRRDALDTPQLRARGEAACRRLFQITALRRARSIACYLAVGGEMDTWPLIDMLLRRGQRCLLPVLHPCQIRRLQFRRWQPDTPLLANRFGIPEPDTRCPPVPARRIDAMVVPLVAFDPNCNRLGMGGGFYDRTLWFRGRFDWRRPLLIGYAHQFQCITRLSVKPTDIPLDYVVTESKIYRR